MQQNALTALGPEIQREIISLSDRIDQRGFQHAQEHIQSEERVRVKEIEDRAVGRKQVLILSGILAGSGLLVGAAITVLMVLGGEYERAYTTLMAGLAVVSALLGGAGLSTALRNVLSKRK